MAKRGAISDLNHDNWDQDEQEEVAGEFSKASKEQLKNRVIKTAKRRITTGTGDETGCGSASAFSGFKGFGKIVPAPATAFSFLANIGATNGGSTTTDSKESEPKKEAGFSGFGGFGNLSTPITSPIAFSSTKPAAETSVEKKSHTGEYASKIKELNLAVTKWIQSHVNENPFCKLTPIFKDYEKYLKEIEDDETKSKDKIADIPAETASKPEFKFGSATEAETEAAAEKSKIQTGFSFGSSVTSLSTSSDKPVFSFGSSAPFSFANVVQAPANSDAKKDDEVDEDEPPKVEFTPVEEKDSVYSKRCKLFVKQDNSFSDRGVGTLHVKKVEDKIQLIVRADTSLGNILLNIILNEAIPTQRMGKNNVMMICLPTPDAKPPPTSVLLRVKTTEEADELLKKLEEFKK